MRDRFLEIYTAALADVLDARGIHDRALDPSIRPLAPGARLAGPAFTIRGRPTATTDYDEAIRRVLTMLGEVPAGHVAVYDTGHDATAHLGELSVTSLAARGVAGALVDGGCRDVAFILETGFPVFTRFVTPADSTWAWELEATQVPVTAGGVRIEPGDWVLGDQDGVVAVPADVQPRCSPRRRRRRPPRARSASRSPRACFPSRRTSGTEPSENERSDAMTTIAADDRDVLTPEAVELLVDLQREFGARREELLAGRAERARRLAAGELPDFLPETRALRESDWRVAAYPEEIADRRVEITGPVDRKMVINALNSGARVFMADFEDANSPTWQNCIDGQRNLTDALERTISLDTGEKQYRLNDEVAVLFVRPRGWHLVERHFEVDGAPMSGSLFDFGLYFHRNHGRNGRYFYLPKLESHHEARLWDDVFRYTQERHGVAAGTIKATVLIETILAAFEMDEILHALRDHSAGLNAGRWDYIFSVIKKLGHRPEFVLPDRAAVTMAVPFMRSYCELLVKTCHRRGAFAMGGMAAFIPSRRDADVNRVALEKVREDKDREASTGLRRHVGRAPGSRARRPGVLRSRARRPAEPDRPAARRRVGRRSRAPGRRRHTGRGDPGGVAQQRLGRDPLPRRVAPGIRGGGDRQPDGGRRDGGDLPIADLAVAPPRARHDRGRAARDRRGRGRARPRTPTRRERCSRRSRRATSTSSS